MGETWAARLHPVSQAVERTADSDARPRPSRLGSYQIRYHFRNDGDWAVSAITASEARKRLFPLIEQVNDDHLPVEIVHKHGNAVLVSKEDWDAMVETAYLSQGANGRMPRRSIAQLRAGEGAVHDPVDDE